MHLCADFPSGDWSCDDRNLTLVVRKEKKGRIYTHQCHTPPVFNLFLRRAAFYFYPFSVSKRAHLCSHAPSFHSSVEGKLQELLQCRPPPPRNWTGSCRQANKERIGQNGEREDEAEWRSSNLPQVNHMTQPIRIRTPRRLRQLAPVSGCLTRFIIR